MVGTIEPRMLMLVSGSVTGETTTEVVQFGDLCMTTTRTEQVRRRSPVVQGCVEELIDASKQSIEKAKTRVT